jgi:hypothetical protein
VISTPPVQIEPEGLDFPQHGDPPDFQGDRAMRRSTGRILWAGALLLAALPAGGVETFTVGGVDPIDRARGPIAEAVSLGGSLLRPRALTPNPDGSIFFELSDGSYELFGQVNSGLGEYGGLVNVGQAGGTVDLPSICFFNDGNVVNGFVFGLTFYRVSGGVPGSEIESYVVSLDEPLSPNFSCGTVALPEPVEVPSRFFLAVSWDRDIFPDVRIPLDTDGPQETVYVRIAGETDWVEGSPAFGEDIRGLALSGLWFPAGQGGDTSPCVDDLGSGVICVLGGRFEMTVTWRNPNAGSAVEPVNLLRFSDAAAEGYFVNSANVELLAKMLDGCALNSQFWVFLGGVTDQNVTVVIRDTETGLVRQYENPAGSPYQTVADTSAFATCP